MTQSALDFSPIITRSFRPGSQCFGILQHLRAGNTLTPLDAFRLFNTLALHSRCSELREAGWPVNCQLVAVNGKTVGRYSLDG